MTDFLSCDALIVGAGPAGLSAAIQLAQSNPKLEIIVLEKGAQVGAHLLSGALFDPSVLDELIPNWRDEKGFPFTPVSSERFCYLTKKHSFSLPVPKRLHHSHCGVISIGHLCQYLAQKAESLGVQIFCGFSGKRLLREKKGKGIKGVHTGNGEPFFIEAKHTFLAEGAHGSLSESVIKEFNLRQHHQSYGLGVKEKWRIDPALHEPGKVMHSVGWPLKNKPYGGGFLYHAESPYVVVGFISALDYSDPNFSPFEQLQHFKTHPSHRALFESGECVGYGARTINEGGWQAIPTCSFPGGYLIGCAAGFVDVAHIKGIHHAMRTAILCAKHSLSSDKQQDITQILKQSKTGKALYRARNIKLYHRFGNLTGLLLSALDQWLLQGCAPWTLYSKKLDRLTLKETNKEKKPFIPDNTITFDRLTQLKHSNTHHQEDAKSHLVASSPIYPDFLDLNAAYYGGPEQHYCPAAVYEHLEKNGQPYLHVNYQNCIHCKACSIKDPGQDIFWSLPRGGDGPNYVGM